MDLAQPLPFPLARPGDPSRLLAALGAALSEDDLLAIARCDYGRDADLHLAQLRGIVRHAALPSPLEWHPGEVLGLTRWSGTESASPQADPTAVHRKRAFCCAALLASMCDPENDGVNVGDTLILLIESLVALDRNLDGETAQLLLSVIAADPELIEGEGAAFLGLGLLYAALADPDWSNAALLALIDWIVANEAAAPRSEANPASENRKWLLTTAWYSSTRAKWHRFGPWLSQRLTDRHDDAVADQVRLIAALLSES